MENNNIINDDAQEWYDSMGQEIQDYEVPPMPEPEPSPEEVAEAEEAEYLEDHPYADAPRVSAEDANSVLNLQKINRPTASIIVGVMDTVLPVVIALIIKGSDRDDAKLSDEERETLTDAWAQYLGTKNVQASPAAVLITCIVTIYGAKLYDAMQHRQQLQHEQRIAEQQEMLRRQQEEIARLRAERSALQADAEHKKPTDEKQ